MMIARQICNTIFWTLLLIFLLAACNPADTSINKPPKLENINPLEHRLGEVVLLQIKATDADNDPLSFKAVGLPNGLVIAVSGQISGKAAKEGHYETTITVKDTKGARDEISFTWTIKPNAQPQLAQLSDRTSNAGDEVTEQLEASDGDGDPLMFEASGLPAGLALSEAGSLAGVLTQAGDYTVTIKVSDPFAAHDSTTFVWTVASSTNSKPVIQAIADMFGQLEDDIQIQVLASDPDGDPLSFSATGLPPKLNITPGGVISGKLSQAGIYNVVIAVQDSKGAEDSATFNWTVSSTPNSKPDIEAIGDKTNQVGDAVDSQLQATDADGDPLSFSAINLPIGLTLSSAGILTGTLSQDGVFEVTVTVSDSKEAASTSFTWTVTPGTTEDALVGWWKFDETSGSVAQDSSALGNHATMRDGNWSSGRLGGAFEATVPKAIVVIPNTESLKSLKTMTVMAWANRTLNENLFLFGHSYTSKLSTSLFLGFHGPAFKWRVDREYNVEGKYGLCVEGEAAINEWYHITGTYDGQFVKLYVDGVLLCSQAMQGDLAMSDEVFTIAGFFNKGDPTVQGRYFGKVDDVRIYNRALSHEEINEILTSP